VEGAAQGSAAAQDGTLARTHHALYVEVRAKAGREDVLL